MIGPAAGEALPEMVNALADSDSRIRWLAAQTIPLLGPEAITALIPLLTNANVNLRHAAVYALGEARTSALPATPALIYRTMHTNESVRASAYYSLSRIGLLAFPETVAIAATNPDAALRSAALCSLIAILPPPGRMPGSPVWNTNNNAEIRRLAILSPSRSRLTNESAMILYQAGLSDEDAAVRETTQRALARLYPTNRNRLAPP